MMQPHNIVNVYWWNHYSELGPVFSSTVAPSVSRLSKWTVNQAVKPWKEPDFATWKWNWPFISWEIKTALQKLLFVSGEGKMQKKVIQRAHILDL